MIPVYSYGIHTGPCGYCKKYNSETKTWEKSKTYVSIGFKPYEPFKDPSIYQDLTNRGWTRSGMYIYQPNNKATCCPQYGLRMGDFQISKTQQKVINRMEKYLSGEDLSKKPETTSKPEKVSFFDDFESSVRFYVESKDVSGDIKYQVVLGKSKKQSLGDYSCNIAVRLSYLIGEKDPEVIAKGIVEIFNQKFGSKVYPDLVKINVEKNGFLNFFVKQEQEDDWDEIETDPIDIKKHKMTFRLIPSVFLEEEYELYKSYQIKIHKDSPDDVTVERYTKFLVDTPLEVIPNKNWSKAPLGFKYGSFHLQYILDDKLIGVSVLDVMPEGLESVYHFYDTDYGFLSMGTYSAVVEARLTQQLTKLDPNFKYYYLGYYVPTCPKMQYKVSFQNSELLCPLTYKWLSCDKSLPMVKKNKYSTFFDGQEEIEKFDLSVHFAGSSMSEEVARMLYPLKEECKIDMAEFKKTLGKSLASKFLYVLADGDMELKKETSNDMFSPFKGGGKSLQEEIKVEKVEKVNFVHQVDENKPFTSIQLRFHDGTRLVEKYNLDEKVDIIFKHVQNLTLVSNFDLMAMHTRKNLVDLDKTIGECDLKGSVLIQKLK